MKERPILFSAPMVRAVLSGAKTQTRRPVTARGWDPQELPFVGQVDHGAKVGLNAYFKSGVDGFGVACPYGRVGDRLWVREAWSPDHIHVYPCWTYVYRADSQFDHVNTKEHLSECRYEREGVKHFECLACESFKWRPSIHMPRQASRILLEVTSVRVERLQKISEADAIAEGISGPHDVGYTAYRVPEDSKPRYSSAAGAFEALWDSINSKRAPWASNPWVWVIGFKRISPAGTP
jgi:hypothetical protein